MKLFTSITATAADVDCMRDDNDFDQETLASLPQHVERTHERCAQRAFIDFRDEFSEECRETADDFELILSETGATYFRYFVQCGTEIFATIWVREHTII